MKFNFLILLSLFAAQIVFAGDKIGNGGGLWACENAQQQIQSSIMVDLFEAQTEFGLSVPSQTSLLAQQIAIQKSQVLQLANRPLSDKINKYLNEVFHKTQFVNAVLTRVDDALFRVAPLPSTCPQGQWDYIQFANFTAQDQVLIRNDVWTSSAVSELDKGALLLHEAVYRWLRVEYSDTNSIRSRQIVGLLFSGLSAQEINLKIQTLLGPPSTPAILDTWACLVTNQNASRSFLGFGQSQLEARVNSADICAQETKAFFCVKESAQCEQAQTNAIVWFCSLTNQNSSRSFAGKGRTKVEASYQVMKNCEDASGGGFFCTNPTCTLNP